jgi:hypothetical protein
VEIDAVVHRLPPFSLDSPLDKASIDGVVPIPYSFCYTIVSEHKIDAAGGSVTIPWHGLVSEKKHPRMAISRLLPLSRVCLDKSILPPPHQ